MTVKYDEIGSGYNSTRKADPYLTQRLVEHLSPVKNGIYLDIGCGTGNYTLELEKKGFQMMGIDPSLKMLEKAKRKNPNMDWKVGTVENIELPDNHVEGIIAFLTIHHWSDLQKGFLEIQRVLKPAGRLVIFTSTPEQMKGYWLNHYFPQMLKHSMLQMPDLARMEKAMKLSRLEILGTENYFVQPNLQDKFLYCGKQNPELYFNQLVRNGISSFSLLAYQAEVEQGLLRLKTDIDHGRINGIIDSYENNLGDYLFLIGTKPAV